MANDTNISYVNQNIRKLNLQDAELRETVNLVPTTKSGRTITFNTNSIQLARHTTIDLVLVQRGSGVPSPSNIRQFVPYSRIDLLVANGSDPSASGYKVTSEFSIQLAQSIYGGVLDVEEGVLTVTYTCIQSYNGESLPDVWLSDRDEYVAGTIPSIGAQVAYQLDEPYTINVVPHIVLLSEGRNYAATNVTRVNIEFNEQGKIASLADIVALANIITEGQGVIPVNPADTGGLNIWIET